MYRKLFGTPYGPKHLIHYDVLKTVKAFSKLGVKPIAWRTHGYEENDYIYYLLAELGFKIISDCRSERFKVFKRNNILHVCINMPVDDNLHNMSPSERASWYEKYIKLLNIKVRQERALVLQLHPVNMALDNFDFLLKIIKVLLKVDSLFYKLSFLIE
jgi:hypothetical protein